MKDVAIRALKTFWQAAVAYLVATLTQGVEVFDEGVIGGLVIGAVAAGLSAAWNGAVKVKGGGVQ